MHFKKQVPDYVTMSFTEVVEHFFNRGVGVGERGVIQTQAQLNDALQGYRSAIWEQDAYGRHIARDIKAYLMLQGLEEHDIRPTATEMAYTYHRMRRQSAGSRLFVWRTKVSVRLEKLFRSFRRP